MIWWVGHGRTDGWMDGWVGWQVDRQNRINVQYVMHTSIAVLLSLGWGGLSDRLISSRNVYRSCFSVWMIRHFRSPTLSFSVATLFFHSASICAMPGESIINVFTERVTYRIMPVHTLFLWSLHQDRLLLWQQQSLESGCGNQLLVDSWNSISIHLQISLLTLERKRCTL